MQLSLEWVGGERRLVESVQGSSDVIRFVAGASRTASPELNAFAEAQKLNLVPELRSASGRSES